MVYTSSVRFSHCFVIVVFNRVESRANKLYFRVPPENLEWKRDENLSATSLRILATLFSCWLLEDQRRVFEFLLAHIQKFRTKRKDISVLDYLFLSLSSIDWTNKKREEKTDFG